MKRYSHVEDSQDVGERHRRLRQEGDQFEILATLLVRFPEVRYIYMRSPILAE